MDIAGAKALKERLGEQGGEDAPAASVDVPEAAPPVYGYLGVSGTAAHEEEAPPKPPRRSVRSRLRVRRSQG